MDIIRLTGASRESTEKAAGEYLYKFILAVLADRGIEEPLHDKFQYHIDTEVNVKKKDLHRPVTIMAGAKTLLAALFAGAVATANEVPLPLDGIPAAVAPLGQPFVTPLKFMLAVVDEFRPLLADSTKCLSREFGSVAGFRAKIEVMVKKKENVKDSAEQLARVYVQFLKCVAVVSANILSETKVTVNEKFLRAVFRVMNGCRPCEPLMDFLQGQLAWSLEHDPRKKAEPKKKEGAKAAAAKKGRPRKAPAAAEDHPPAAGGKEEEEAPAETEPAETASETASETEPAETEPAETASETEAAPTGSADGSDDDNDDTAASPPGPAADTAATRAALSAAKAVNDNLDDLLADIS